MPTKKKENVASVEVISDTNLPNVWIDRINLAVREDDICLLRFFSQLPEGTFEQSRITVTKKVMLSLIDVLTTNLDYYPKKKLAKAKRVKSAKAKRVKSAKAKPLTLRAAKAKAKKAIK